MSKNIFINKYEVGYDDQLIGVYSGFDEDEAINNCKEHIRDSKQYQYLSVSRRLNKPFFAIKL